MADTPNVTEEKGYDVHIYAIVRLKVSGIKAGSQKKAIVKAEEVTPLHQLLDRIDINRELEDGIVLKDIEFAEDIDSFLVDEHSDEEYERTGAYMFDGETPSLHRDTRVEVYLDNGQIAIHRLPPGVSIKRIQGPLSVSVEGEDPFRDQHETKGPVGKEFERIMEFYKTV